MLRPQAVWVSPPGQGAALGDGGWVTLLPLVLPLHSLTPQNLHQREGDSETVVVLTGEGAGWSSQPGRGSITSPHAASASLALRNSFGPAQTPDPRGRKGAAIQRGPVGRRNSRGEPPWETQEFRGKKGCVVFHWPLRSWGQHREPRDSWLRDFLVRSRKAGPSWDPWDLPDSR